jgi:hypothetical protein
MVDHRTLLGYFGCIYSRLSIFWVQVNVPDFIDLEPVRAHGPQPHETFLPEDTQRPQGNLLVVSSLFDHLCPTISFLDDIIKCE